MKNCEIPSVNEKYNGIEYHNYSAIAPYTGCLKIDTTH